MIDHGSSLAEKNTSSERRNVASCQGDRQESLGGSHTSGLAPARFPIPPTNRANTLQMAINKPGTMSEGQAIFVANKGTIVLVLTVFVLVVYAIAGYATPKLIANSDSLLSSTLHDLVGLGSDSINVETSKGFDKTSIDAVQAAMPTFSRSWYIESSPDTR